MLPFYKPRVFKSAEGCCICTRKSSRSRFTRSQPYEDSFKGCFKLDEPRTGIICQPCVQNVKRWRQLPKVPNQRDWSHIVDSKIGLRRTLKSEEVNVTLEATTTPPESDIEDEELDIRQNFIPIRATPVPVSPLPLTGMKKRKAFKPRRLSKWTRRGFRSLSFSKWSPPDSDSSPDSSSDSSLDGPPDNPTDSTVSIPNTASLTASPESVQILSSESEEDIEIEEIDLISEIEEEREIESVQILTSESEEEIDLNSEIEDDIDIESVQILSRESDEDSEIEVSVHILSSESEEESEIGSVQILSSESEEEIEIEVIDLD